MDTTTSFTMNKIDLLNEAWENTDKEYHKIKINKN